MGCLSAAMRQIDHGFVVNLDRRSDRLMAFLERVPPELVGHLERVPAVDGSLLEADKAVLGLFDGNNFQYRRNVMGCALSHYALWKRIAGTDFPHHTVAIFEDDVWFSQGFLLLWNNEIAPNLPRDFDLIYLGGLLGPSTWRQLQEVAERFNGRIVIPIETYAASRVNDSLAVPRQNQFCTYSYVLSKAGAQKLCAFVEQEGIRVAIDWFLIHRWHRLKVYVTVPLLCWSVSQEGSDIIGNVDSLLEPSTLHPEISSA
jgi:GR25 family glycosyltransferase involved in LPS biosynthesis